MNSMRLSIPFLLIIVLGMLGCQEAPERSNPFDAESDQFILGELTGKVMPDNARPIIEAWLDDDLELRIYANSNRYIISDLPEGNYDLVIKADGFVSDSTLKDVKVKAREVTDVGTSYLNVSGMGAIAGKLEPAIEGVTVSLIQRDTISTATNTNRDGEFNFSMLHPGSYSILVNAEGYSEFRSEVYVVSAGNTTNIGTIVLNDNSRGSISGVIAPRNSSAIVLLKKEENPVDSTIIDPFTGQYFFMALNPDTYVLEVRADGYTNQKSSDIVVVAGETNGSNNFTLERVASISGMVIPKTAGAEVNLLLNGDVVVSASVNPADGTYSLENLAAGTYTVRIEAQGWSTWESSDPVNLRAGETTSLERVYLSERGSNVVYGRVVDSISENAISNAEISLVNQIQSSDAEGYFAFRDVSAGIGSFQVSHESYLSVLSSLSIPETGSTHLFIDLVPAGGLSGEVSNSETGQPIVNARIALDGGDFATFSNANGVYSFLSLPDGEHFLSCQKNQFQTFQQTINIRSNGNTEKNINLIPLEAVTGTISGVVRRSTDNSLLPWTFVEVAGRTTTTGGDGTFEFQNIQEGNHMVNFSRDGFLDGIVSVSVTAGETSDASIRLDPENANRPEATLTVQLINALNMNPIIFTGSYTVYFTYRNGAFEPLQWITEFTNGQGQIQNLIGGDPNYNTSTIYAGTYHLWGGAAPFGAYGFKSFDEIVVVNAGNNSYELRLDPLCSVGGIVTNSMNGEPIQGAMLGVLGTSSEVGSFYKNGVDPDLSTIYISAAKFYDGDFDLTLTPNQHNYIPIELTPLPVVRGHITDASTGDPLANVEITSSQAEPTITNNDGYYEILFELSGPSTINFARNWYLNQSYNLIIPYSGITEVDIELHRN
ncbi:carboxypeptidase regulatory-like domain-containing protein [bacterium]|nr:carboxypeptidase regulatory-like domain-containing protein [bacterium]